MEYVTQVFVDSVTAQSEFISKLTSILTTLIPAVENYASEIWLFGSVARNDANALSDLDLLVLVDTTDPKYRKKVSIAVEFTDLREDVGFIPVDIIVRTRKFMESEDLFAKLVQRDKKVLWRR